MVGMKRKSIEIARELNMPEEDILKMTLAEINNEYEKRYLKVVQKRMSEGIMMRRFAVLMPDYEYLRSYFGDMLEEGFCRANKWDYILKRNRCYGSKKDNCPDEEKKKIIFEQDGYTEYEWQLNSTYFGEGLQNALQLRYPELSEFAPYIYSYSIPESSKNVKVTLTLNKSIDEAGNEKKDTLDISLKALLSGSKKTIIEDYLDSRQFEKVKSKDDPKFIEINELLKSPGAIKFYEIAKKIVS